MHLSSFQFLTPVVHAAQVEGRKAKEIEKFTSAKTHPKLDSKNKWTNKEHLSRWQSDVPDWFLFVQKTLSQTIKNHTCTSAFKVNVLRQRRTTQHKQCENGLVPFYTVYKIQGCGPKNISNNVITLLTILMLWEMVGREASFFLACSFLSFGGKEL